MISHRTQSHPALPEPPIQFYRTIAISFIFLTIVLLGAIVLLTSKKAEILIVAKEDNKKISATFTVGGTNPESLPATVTTTQFFWSETYYPTGTETVYGTSTGHATLYNHTDAPQTLVKTTRLLSPTGVLYRLADKVIIPSNGTITAEIYADQPGAGSDLQPTKFTIPGLLPAKQKLIYAETTAPITNGPIKIGVISADDIKTAQANFREKVSQAYQASLTRQAPSSSKAIVVVTNDALTTNRNAGERVSEFSVSGTSTLLIATVDAHTLDLRIQRETNRNIDLSLEKVLSIRNDPDFTLSAFNPEKGEAQLTFNQNAIVTLDANGSQLAGTIFAGKKKDEIERYVLGLNHVANVGVTFSPGWIGSAPSSPDHIRVIVKSTK